MLEKAKKVEEQEKKPVIWRRVPNVRNPVLDKTKKKKNVETADAATQTEESDWAILKYQLKKKKEMLKRNLKGLNPSQIGNFQKHQAAFGYQKPVYSEDERRTSVEGAKQDKAKYFSPNPRANMTSNSNLSNSAFSSSQNQEFSERLRTDIKAIKDSKFSRRLEKNGVDSDD